MGTERKGWIDLIRGFCVFLVVLGHIWQDSGFHLFTDHIKMPMFYVITGMLVKTNKRPLPYIKDLIFRIGIPWITFSFIWLRCPYYAVKGDWAHLTETLTDFLTGKSLWFVPSFFCSQLLFYSICKLSHNKKSILAILSITFFIIAYVVKDISFFRLWCIDTALSSLIYLFIGYCLKEHMNSIERINAKWCFLSVILYLGICGAALLIRPMPEIDFHNVRYGNLPIDVLLVLLGIVASISFGILLDR